MSEKTSHWAIILGGSSGLGLATAQKLAKHGYNLFILHRDRRADITAIEAHFQEMRHYGIKLYSFNIDATNTEKIKETLPQITHILGNDKISVMVHSIAKGNLKPLISENSNSLKLQDFQLTIHAMGTSLYQWAMELIQQNTLAKDTRVIAFTSEGSTKAWKGYAGVSAAKATLEAIVRSMALEFAPLGLKVNCIQAGVTNTKSFRMIPNSDTLREQAIARNPFHRLTTSEDVANAAYLLTLDEARWINGTIIKVDGGESLQ